VLRRKKKVPHTKETAEGIEGPLAALHIGPLLRQSSWGKSGAATEKKKSPSASSLLEGGAGNRQPFEEIHGRDLDGPATSLSQRGERKRKVDVEEGSRRVGGGAPVFFRRT